MAKEADKSVKEFVRKVVEEYGNKLASIILIGSTASGELSKVDDYDIEVVFKDKKDITEEIVYSIGDIARLVDFRIHVYVEHLDQYYKSGEFEAKGDFKGSSTVLLNLEKTTGIILFGKDILKNVKIDKIPSKEGLALIGRASIEISRGKLAKAVLKTAYGYMILQDNKPVEVKDRQYYKAIRDKAEKFFSKEEFTIVDKAYKMKIGKGEISKEEAQKFLEKVRAKI
jgi:predicted nucleotidyltransferase